MHQSTHCESLEFPATSCGRSSERTRTFQNELLQPLRRQIHGVTRLTASYCQNAGLHKPEWTISSGAEGEDCSEQKVASQESKSKTWKRNGPRCHSRSALWDLTHECTESYDSSWEGLGPCTEPCRDGKARDEG